MAYNTDDFTSNIVAVVIAVIVIAAVAVPIINGMIGTDTESKDYPIDEGSTIATIVEVIPIFLVLAVLMMVVYLFLNKRGN